MADELRLPPKKSEMIEVRVTYETKRDFLAACRSEGRTASDVVRQSIDDFIRGQGRPAAPEKRLMMSLPKPRKRYLAASLAVAGASLLVALPSAAAPGPDVVFKSLDTNSDGVLTIEEFSKKPDGMSRKDVRKLQQGGSASTPSDPANARVYLILPDTDGKAAEQLRDVRFQSVGGAPASPEDRVRQDFPNYDANKDGKIDFNEYRTRLRTMLGNGFTKLDTDNSGALDAKEYEALSANLLILPPDGVPALGIPGSYGPLMTAETLDAAFKAHDTNNDGKLTLEEYLPAA